MRRPAIGAGTVGERADGSDGVVLVDDQFHIAGPAADETAAPGVDGGAARPAAVRIGRPEGRKELPRRLPVPALLQRI